MKSIKKAQFELSLFSDIFAISFFGLAKLFNKQIINRLALK